MQIKEFQGIISQKYENRDRGIPATFCGLSKRWGSLPRPACHCGPGPKEPIRKIARQSQVLRRDLFSNSILTCIKV